MQINLKRQLTQFEWLQLPKEVQFLFKKWFSIPRTGGAIVVNDKVISDGHTNEDLSAVSLGSLQAFLHTDDDHWDNLLKETINKMENYIDGNEVSDNTKHPGPSQAGGVKKAKKAYKRKALAVP